MFFNLNRYICSFFLRLNRLYPLHEIVSEWTDDSNSTIKSSLLKQRQTGGGSWVGKNLALGFTNVGARLDC